MTETSKFWGELFSEILWIEGKMAKLRTSKNQFLLFGNILILWCINASHCWTGQSSSVYLKWEMRANKINQRLLLYKDMQFHHSRVTNTCTRANSRWLHKSIYLSIYPRKPFWKRVYIYIYIYMDFSKPAPTQTSHSETFAGNITAAPVNYGLATRHQRESLLTFPHLNWEFG